MKTYKTIALSKAYKLLNTGALIVISTSDANQHHNLAPIAWNCPVEFDPVTQLLLVSDREHKTFKNIKETQKFTVCMPHSSQHKLVTDLGSCSGHDTDKISKYHLPVFKSEKHGYSVPEDVIAYLDCSLIRIIDEGSVAIVIGEVIHAAADAKAFTDRLLSENEEGKTLHHLGGKLFIEPGQLVNGK
jgi:flavin reductase (DIM6/NTAB) family NADH-FMN oxidoreductase RutF